MSKRERGKEQKRKNKTGGARQECKREKAREKEINYYTGKKKISLKLS